MVRPPAQRGTRFVPVLVLCAALAFTACRGSSPTDEIPAATSPTPGTPTPSQSNPAVLAATPAVVSAPPGWDATPLPGATPDTSQELWYLPYLNAAIKSPIFNGTIAGIRIGPGVDPGLACTTARITTGALQDATGTPVDPQSAFQPDGLGATEHVIVGLCEGKPVLAEATFLVFSDPAIKRFGGTIQVYRHYGAPIVIRAIPSDRWSESTIAGYPAAVARPILPDIGLGESAVAIYANGIVTAIDATGIPLDQLLQFAEGLFPQN